MSESQFMKRISIRSLSPEDLPLLYHYGKEFFERAKMPGKWSDEEFNKNWSFLLEKGIGGILGAFLKTGDGDIIIGAIGSVISSELCTGAPYASELFLYVGDEYRHGVGKKLVQEFERWSREAGVRRIHLTNRFAMGLEVGTLYKRLGYEPAEAVWVKDVELEVN
jgi:GNAT superfamily N-acetyltransferase